MQIARKDVQENLTWDLTPLYKNQEEWQTRYDEIQKEIDFTEYEGKLSDANVLLDCLKKMHELGAKLEHLAVYAMLKRDQDTRDSIANEMSAKVDSIFVDFSSKVAFITPELTALDEKVLQGFIADEKFKDYDYMLECIVKEKPYVLPLEVEQVLAMGGQVFGGYQTIFSKINNADLKFPEIEVDGKKVVITHGMYSVLMQSKDRKVREQAFTAFYKSFEELLNTITATYVGSVQKDVYLSKVRKYNSCLEKALKSEDVDVEVYNNLLTAVSGGLPLLHRFIADRKNILGVEELHMYDLYTALVEDAEIKVDYEEAFKIVKEGLKPLGSEYAKLLDRAHDERWIDVVETEGKRSGAYSMDVYAIPHPYVLLNYQQTTHDVFTIAHELGHAMHSYHSDKAQPVSKADYKIFVAEVASTVNEVLLLKHLIKTTEDVKLKKYLSSYYLDMIRTTCFRQTMFAEFEYLSHNAVENNIPLTKESLSKMYLELNQKYYGKDIVSDREISFEWARIPHFYTSFYVYKYATGIISAISIAERILSEGQTAVDDYFKFLSSGGSNSPVELLKLAGVDLTKQDAFKTAMQSFESMLNEFENL